MVFASESTSAGKALRASQETCMVLMQTQRGHAMESHCVVCAVVRTSGFEGKGLYSRNDSSSKSSVCNASKQNLDWDGKGQ